MSLRAILETETDEIIQEYISRMTDEEFLNFKYDWSEWAREKQLEPAGAWQVWLILAGRGFGKTRTGAEWIRQRVNEGYKRIGVVAPTAADLRQTIIEGESGILNVFPPYQEPLYEPSKRKVTFHTGAVATLYSGDAPDRLRGHNSDTIWIDELIACKYPKEVYSMAMLGLRIGKRPRCLITTTPKPIPLLKEMITKPIVHLTKGSTYENESNLASTFIDMIKAEFEGTRLGAQELHAEILGDLEGALWNRDLLERQRVTKAPKLQTTVLAIDPAASTSNTSAETGIVVAARDMKGQGYILEDVSIKGSPKEWATAAITAFYKNDCDVMIVETNQGGNMIKAVIHSIDPRIPIREVRASKGKFTRAEPIGALYEQGKIWHVGFFGKLEDQMCNFIQDADQTELKDRVDAAVWALTYLMLKQRKPVKPHANAFDELGKANAWENYD